MALYDLLITQAELFLIVLVRMLGLFLILPVYGERGIPMTLKIGLAVCMSYLTFPMVMHTDFALPRTFTALAMAIAGEMMIGLVIGFFVKLLLSAVQIAGSFVGFQMGFAIVNVVDPSGTQVSLIARFQELLATMIFFALSLDHIFLAGLMQSYHIVPPLGLHLGAPGLELIVDRSVQMWVVAVKVGAPVMITLFAVNVAMGLIARSVPQMNVFIVGFPVTIGTGLILLGLSLPIFVEVFKRFVVGLGPVVDRFLFLAS